MNFRLTKKILFTAILTLLMAESVFAQAMTNRRYPDVVQFLQNLARQYPDNVKLMNIGFDDAGILIEGVAIGNGPVKNLVVGTHHGNEYGSTEIALGFAADMAASPILEQTIYVIPVLNIQGYNNRSRWQNVKGQSLDPNRDYPGPCGTKGPHKMKATLNLANFIDQNQIVVSATIHTYMPGVLYPWGISTHEVNTPYTPKFIELGMAATYVSKYQVGNSTDLLYPADGTFEDYAYWKHGIWSLLFEAGRTHSPSLPSVEELVRVNVPGLRKMFEIAPTTRAENHEFTGKCDIALRALDLQIE